MKILYAKLAGVFFIVVLIFGSGVYVGHLSLAAKLSAYKTDVERQHVTQLQAVVKVLEDNARQVAADHAQQQGIIDAYDKIKDLPEPASIGTAHRVFLIAASAVDSGGCSVPEAGNVAGGGADPTGGTHKAREAEPGLVTILEKDLDEYIAACGRDDKRLILNQELARSRRLAPQR